MRRACASLCLVVATLWAAAIFVAPRVVASGAEHPIWSDLGALVYLAGGVVCHQRPERSFHAAGVQYPVCARCTGLYVSAPLGMIAAIGFLRGRQSYRRWRIVLAVAIVPTLVSILLERLGGPSDTVSRALAALPLGAAAAAFVVTAVLGHFAHDFGGPEARAVRPGSGV